MTFAATIRDHHARMSELRTTYEQQGYIYARSQRDPEYAIFLHPGTSAAYEVHSFRDGEPIGHRDYDAFRYELRRVSFRELGRIR